MHHIPSQEQILGALPHMGLEGRRFPAWTCYLARRQKTQHMSRWDLYKKKAKEIQLVRYLRNCSKFCFSEFSSIIHDINGFLSIP
jgi:hypothetical protein